jgi:hypothetical protein
MIGQRSEKLENESDDNTTMWTMRYGFLSFKRCGGAVTHLMKLSDGAACMFVSGTGASPPLVSVIDVRSGEIDRVAENSAPSVDSRLRQRGTLESKLNEVVPKEEGSSHCHHTDIKLFTGREALYGLRSGKKRSNPKCRMRFGDEATSKA